MICYKLIIFKEQDIKLYKSERLLIIMVFTRDIVVPGLLVVGLLSISIYHGVKYLKQGECVKGRG